MKGCHHFLSISVCQVLCRPDLREPQKDDSLLCPVTNGQPGLRESMHLQEHTAPSSLVLTLCLSVTHHPQVLVTFPGQVHQGELCPPKES
jgi:hypothetical protein